MNRQPINSQLLHTIAWRAMQAAVVLCFIIGANLATAPKANALFGSFCSSPQLCVSWPWYRLRCANLCCGGVCPISDSGTHNQLSRRFDEVNSNATALNTITAITAINAITLKLGIGEAGEAPFELPLIAAPVMSMDPMTVDYNSGCVGTLAQGIADDRYPPPPPAFIKELNEDMPNPAFHDWVKRAYYASLSALIEAPGRFLEFNASQDATREWCRSKYVGDVGQIQAANGMATLQMIRAYQTRMAEYMAAFIKANEPCKVEDLSFMQVALTQGIGALIGNSPTEVAVMGCMRLDIKIKAMMARDTLIIKDHMRMLEAMEGWSDSAVGIARYGKSVFPRLQ